MDTDDRQAGDQKGKYPDALSRKFGEGGYTFLKRVLAKSLETGGPVIMNIGENYLEYSYKDGARTFMDGVTLIEGSDQDAFDALKETADEYRLEQGLAEIKAEQEFHREGKRPL
jgi:hypothetical protein